MERSRGDAGEGNALLQLEGGRKRLLREEDATSTAPGLGGAFLPRT